MKPCSCATAARVLSDVCGRVRLAGGSVSRQPAPRAEQPNRAVGGFLDERARRGHGDTVGSRVCEPQGLEATAARREDDIHHLEQRLILNPAEVIALLLAELRCRSAPGDAFRARPKCRDPASCPPLFAERSRGRPA